MTNRQPVPLLLVLVLCAVTIGQAQSNGSETLGSVKQKYLNQRVVIGGSVMNSSLQGPVLTTWYAAAAEPGGRYRADMSNNAAASDKGQAGLVIAIQLDDALGRSVGPRTNALGEVISPDQTVDPYLDVVVKLDNGNIVITTAYPSTVDLAIQLAVAQEALAKEMSANIGSVVGKKLYAAGFSRLYQPDSTLEEMEGLSEIIKRIPITEIPLLEPLVITAAKYVETPDELMHTAVVLKLKLPDGREALSITSSFTDVDKDATFLEKISGFLLTTVPKDLTPQEIAAIKKISVFRGMRKEAVHYALGFPKEENDWGKGGKQLIYTDDLIIYVNNQEKVVDWQSFKN